MMASEDSDREQLLQQRQALERGGFRLPAPSNVLSAAHYAQRLQNPQPPTPQQIADQARQEELNTIGRRSEFIQSAFTVGTTAIQLRVKEQRSYLLIQNTSAAGVLYLSFGNSNTALAGLQIAAGGYYEPFQVPQNDIYIFGSVAGVTGVLLFAP